jgi:hypothetical protein
VALNIYSNGGNGGKGGKIFSEKLIHFLKEKIIFFF